MARINPQRRRHTDSNTPNSEERDRRRSKRTKDEKYAVALSFAGPDRLFAESVARGLKAHGVTVFYDRFEEHELWGRYLHEALREVYTKECRYCVLILTPDYLNRMWPVFERRQIIERMVTDYGEESVLPVRLEDFADEVPGLSNAIVYLMLKQHEHQRVVDALLGKLGLERPVDGAESYARAQQMLARRRQGYVPYDRVFTSTESVLRSFRSVIHDEILQFEGNELYWTRAPNEPLLLLAKNDLVGSLKGKGLTVICRFDAPSVWVGCGRWLRAWPGTKAGTSDALTKSESFEMLILLYLYSSNPQEVDRLVGSEETTAFLGAFYFGPENADHFYEVVERNYEDLR